MYMVYCVWWVRCTRLFVWQNVCSISVVCKVICLFFVRNEQEEKDTSDPLLEEEASTIQDSSTEQPTNTLIMT